jgi:hypothetical protein
LPLWIPPGAEKLASTRLAAQATTTVTLSFPAYDLLWILCLIGGCAVADLPRLRFNGISTAANYTQRMGYFGTAASATVSNQSDNGATNGAFILGQNTSVSARLAIVTVNNHVQSAQKPVTIEDALSTAGATTEMNPVVLRNTGQFTAASAATQITSVVMLTPTNAMLTGTGLIVFGMNM